MKLLLSIILIFILEGCSPEGTDEKSTSDIQNAECLFEDTQTDEIITFTGYNTTDSQEIDPLEEDTQETKIFNEIITFTENSAINTLNPDRGFYNADYNLNEAKSYNMFKGPKEDGLTLVYAPINLKDYKDTIILPQTLLDTIETNFGNAREMGIKLILRIKYRLSSDDVSDPSKIIILSHLEQLKSTLQSNKDIISVVQAGTIGAWGEWHSFTGDFADTNSSYVENRKSIIQKLEEIFPDKYLQIRTPMHKEQLFGSSQKYEDESSDATITSCMAFSDDIKAKIGHHNDCFLASETDKGTYPSDNIDFWKEYVVNDSMYAPVGGETCKDDSTYTNCSNTISELNKFHYSFISTAYHPDVVQRWKDEACYDEIKENIGYRLVATELNISQVADTISLSLSILNKGYASPYVKSEVSYILKNENNSYEYSLSNVDLRTYFSGESRSINANISLIGVEAGEYCLHLQMGKTFSAIRLSNSDLWDDSSLTNILTCNIVVE